MLFLESFIAAKAGGWSVNSQIKRRTRVVGLFPNESSLLRLVTGVVIKISEEWETGKIYLQPETKKQPN